MHTRSHKSRFSEQQTHIRLGYLMAYLLNSRAVKIWPGWLFLLLGLAVADASYGQGTGGTTESSSLCSANPGTWTVRDGIISRKLTDYTYSDTGADISKPIGGWDKYYAQRIITEKESESSTYKKASNLTQLKNKLSSATAGDTIFVVGTADILVTERLAIPSGVTLASNRGQAISSGAHVSDGFALGALLRIDDLASGSPNLLIVEGDNVRITGLRLRGPQREVHPWDEGNDRVGIMNASFGKVPKNKMPEIPSKGYENLEVDNCELFQWPQSAIYVGHGGSACIRNNYIHHNQRWKSGYGVGLQGSANVSIEENLFAFNRHCVAGTGYPTQEYTARHNVVLASNNPPFDMHGLIEGCSSNVNSSWDCYQAKKAVAGGGFDYDVTGSSSVGGFWHFGRSETNETLPPDNQIGGKKIHITRNTVASVTNNHKPMDLAERKSLNAGRFDSIEAVYLRGVPWVEAVVDSNSFAHSSRWGGAYKQFKVSSVDYTLPFHFNTSANEASNGISNVWDHDNNYRRFFERFGDVFQEMEETTIPGNGRFLFSSDKWRYKWSADSGSGYRLKSSVLQTWRVQNRDSTATTKHDRNDPIGEMRSKRSQINKNYVSFRIAGFKYEDEFDERGRIINTSCTTDGSRYANQVAMLSAHDDAVIFKKNVPCTEPFELYAHDLSSYNDDDNNNNDTWAYFVLSDGDWHDGGWIEVDDIYFFDDAPAKPANLRAEVDYEGVRSFDDIPIRHRTSWDDIVILSWDDPNNPSISEWKYQWRESGSAWDDNNQQSISWKNVNYITENGQARITTRARAPINPPMATTYEYRVRGVNKDSTGAASDSVRVEILAFPGAPERLQAAAGDTSATLTWEAPRSDGGSAITGYTYRYRTGASEPWMPSADGVTLNETTSYVRDTISNLTNGTTYTFKVRARTARGTGPASTAEVTLNSAPAITGRASPSFNETSTDTVATYTATDAERNAITWSLKGTDKAAFQFSPVARAANTIALSFRSAPDYERPSDLSTPDNVYEVTVVATDDGTPELTTDYPVEITVENVDEDGAIVLSPLVPQVGVPFTAELTDQDGGITGARWQWQGQQPGTTTWQTLAGTSSESQSSSSSRSSSRSSSSSQPYPALSSYTPQVAQMGWTLRAVVNTYRDAFGAGKTAESLATAPVQAGVPTAPENLSAAPSDQSVTLTWEAPTSNGGAEITGYTYRYRPDGGTTWLPSADGTTVEETTLYVQQTINDLTNGTQYTFQVWANNPDIGAIAQETATPGVPPPAPRGVEARAGEGNIQLSWTQVVATPEVLGHQMRYQRQPAQPGIADWSAVDHVDLATLDHSRTRYSQLGDAEGYLLHPGHRYRYQVRARNEIGYGAWSEPFPANGVIVQVNAPRLAGLALDDESVGLAATWTCPNYLLCAPAPPRWPEAALRLTAQYKSGLSSWSAGSAQGAGGATNQVVTTHRVGGLSRRVVHEFQTRAVNADGIAGLASPSVALVPLRTQTASGTDQVSLSWDRPSGYEGLAWQYRYKAATSSSWGGWRSVSTSGTTAQTVSGLTRSVSYQFQVQAVSGGMARVVSFIESATPGGVVPTPSVTVSLGSDSYRAREGDVGVSITVVLSQAQAQAIAMPVSVSAATGTDADDYTVTGRTAAGMVSFEAGDRLRSFTISANEDADTTDDSVRVSLGTPPAGIRTGQPAQATVTLADNDDPDHPSGSVWLSSQSPQVGRQLTATLMDASGNISGTSWQWQRRRNASSPWQSAAGASWSLHTTVSVYIPAESDEDYQLRVTARYDDTHRNGQTAQSDPTNAVVARTVAVTDPAGSVSLSSQSPQVDRQLTATLTDDSGLISGTSWQWQRRRNASSPWQPAAGASTTLHTTVSIYWPEDSDVGYQLQATARYDDADDRGQTAHSDPTHAVARPVVAVVNPSGSVSLSSQSPQVDRQLTATLTDLSGGISGATWQWQRRSGTRAWESATGTWSQPYPWISIYRPQSGDVGYLLRATVRYNDTHSKGQTAQSTATDAVRPAPPPPPPPPSDSKPVVGTPDPITCYVREYCSYTFPTASRGTSPITYRVSPPSWATASGRSFSGTAPSSPGTYSASLNASNAYGTDSASLTINVKRRPVTRVAPVVSSAGSITCYVGEYCSYTFPTASRGTSPITYRVSPPSWATASGRSFSGTAPSSPGTYSASLNASNAYGMDSASLTINVKRRGVAPVLPSAGSITCYVGEYCSYTFPSASRGTSPITYRVSPPSWATASGRGFSGTAPSSPGTYSASLNASNAYGTDSESVTINVERRPVAGVAPVLPSVSSITCYVGEYCSYTFPSASSGTSPITYRVSPPSWATASGRGFSGTAPSSPGTYSASLNASNAYGTDSESVTINVKRRSVSALGSPSSPWAESGVAVRGRGRCIGLVAITWPERTAEGDIHRSGSRRRM